MMRSLLTATLSRLLFTALGLGIFSSATAAYPERPMKIITPMAAGGGTDTIARLFAQKLSLKLEQPVIVENKPGAAGQIGAELAAASVPDGYTFFMTSSTALTLPYLRATKFELNRDFVPIGQIGIGAFALAINNKLPFDTIQGFLADVKANPSKYTYGSPGIGSAGHLATELFSMKAGIKMVHVPFKSSTEVLQSLISGQIDSAIDILTIEQPHIESKAVRGLATTGKTRDPSLPNLPTFNEANLIQGGFEMTFWYGLFLPVRAPAVVIQKAQEAFSSIMSDPEILARLRQFSLSPSTLTATEFKKNMADETAVWIKIITETGVQVN